MLVDLERNDLGRICRGGTVEVDEYMTIETYATVHHIVSNVRGVLRDDVTPGQAIAAVFPGGTITGCPKVRCMQLLAGLEREPRDAYTGSLGYLGPDGSMDLNILIRTLTRARRRDRISDRGRHRGRLDTRGGTGRNPRQGARHPAGAGRTNDDRTQTGQWRGRRAASSADDRGLQYGDGLFETMAASNGRVRRFRPAHGAPRRGLPPPRDADARRST